MKTNHNNIICTILLLLSAFSAVAQNDVIIKAMKDEIARNMNELRLEDQSKPFFIGYGINDYNVYGAYASLGAIIQSGDAVNRTKNVRVIVGDYEFNDESLDNNMFSNPGAGEIELPIENDYAGIRRALWVTTDGVFKSASMKFNRHKQTLKEQNKKLTELPHRTFAKVPVENIVQEGNFMPVNYQKLDEYIRNISAVFKTYPEIENSGVVGTYVYGHRYVVTSEGTTVKVPTQICFVQVSAQTKTPDGGFTFDAFTLQVNHPNELPPLDAAVSKTKALVEKLMITREQPTFEEDYAGPVLFLNSSVSTVVLGTFFGGEEGLMASNTIRSTNGFRMETGPTIDAKIGKNFVDNAITIKSKPTLKQFNGETLFGAFEIDSEGVRPKDELVLVENGVLQNLMNDRSITHSSQTANGHADGPGVIELTVKGGVTEAALKQKLIQTAKEEGLDFAIIIKESPSDVMGMVDVYKVSLETGEEKFFRAASIDNLTLRSFKKIGGATSDLQVRHQSEGGIVSLIVPTGLLLNDVTITPGAVPVMEEETFVENPLKRN